MWRSGRMPQGLVVALWLAGAWAAAGTFPVGYCTCTSTGCQMVVGYDSMGQPIWRTVSSCPTTRSAGTSCQTRYNMVEALARQAERAAWMAAEAGGAPEDLRMTVPGVDPNDRAGDVTFQEFYETAVKGNKMGEGVKVKLSRLPGESASILDKPVYGSAQEAWEDYKSRKAEEAAQERAGAGDSHFELPRADLPLRSFAALARTSFRRTHVNSDISLVGGKEVESKAFTQSLTLVSYGRFWRLAVEATVEREEHGSDFDGLDNTSLRLMVAPIYRLLRREVHGFDLNVGCNVGYQHTWYDEDRELDRPLGTRWGMGDFRNPDLFTIGAMVGAVVPWRLGETALACSYQWGLDIHSDGMLAGNDHLDYLTVLGRHSVTIYRNLYAALQGTLSHTNDLPTRWDDTTCSGAVEVGWRARRWRLGCSLRRDFADSNISEWACLVDFGMTW